MYSVLVFFYAIKVEIYPICSEVGEFGERETLILINQEDQIRIVKEQEIVLRNWSYCEVQTMTK